MIGFSISSLIEEGLDLLPLRAAFDFVFDFECSFRLLYLEHQVLQERAAESLLLS